ncbi:isochorismatase family protein [Erwinia sp. CPCC 100877]|nr:isochorismatase family protein [Erwinia sp. CPCC 100877]
MKQALVIIDVQNDYFPNGKMALHEPENALAEIQKLEAYFNKNNYPIIYVQHIKENPQAAFFGRDTLGARLHSGLAATDRSIIIEKHYPNSFIDTSLQATLTDLAVEQVVITGMMTQMCVDSTTRASKELGFQPILIADATATKTLTFAGTSVSAQAVEAAFLSALSNFAEVLSAEEFLSNR